MVNCRQSVTVSMITTPTASTRAGNSGEDVCVLKPNCGGRVARNWRARARRTSYRYHQPGCRAMTAIVNFQHALSEAGQPNATTIR